MKKHFLGLIVISFLLFACSTKDTKPIDNHNDFAVLDSLIRQLEGKWELKNEKMG